jgi:hypothetical protein
MTYYYENEFDGIEIHFNESDMPILFTHTPHLIPIKIDVTDLVARKLSDIYRRKLNNSALLNCEIEFIQYVEKAWEKAQDHKQEWARSANERSHKEIA